MTTIKITKKDMVEAITEYLSAQGQRMTNLKKASEEQLQELVERYKIDIQEFAKNRKEEMKKQRAIDKKAKEKRDEEDMELNQMETCWKCETKIDTEKDKGWEYCSCLDAHFCSRCSPTNTCFCECDGSCDCANCVFEVWSDEEGGGVVRL